MKLCACCSAVAANEAAPHCHACGEGSWVACGSSPAPVLRAAPSEVESVSADVMAPSEVESVSAFGGGKKGKRR